MTRGTDAGRTSGDAFGGTHCGTCSNAFGGTPSDAYANARNGRIEPRRIPEDRPAASHMNDGQRGFAAALRALLRRRSVPDRNPATLRLPADRCSTGHARHAMRSHQPPAPPIALTPLLACDPTTNPDILWHIAREAPELRRWLVANPNADAALLEYVAQAGGPGVNVALTVLLEG